MSTLPSAKCNEWYMRRQCIHHDLLGHFSVKLPDCRQLKQICFFSSKSIAGVGAVIACDTHREASSSAIIFAFLITGKCLKHWTVEVERAVSKNRRDKQTNQPEEGIEQQRRKKVHYGD
jgi:hypothetical protein